MEDILITIEMRREYLTQGFMLRLGDNGIINRFLVNTLSINASHNQYLLFCEIMRQYRDRQIDSGPKDMQQIMEILAYIEKNCLTVTLKSAADRFGFHHNYLSAYIKKNTGQPFKELVITQRMCQACFYLTNTDMPVYEVADRIGYDNLGFFYKKFEKIYKMTPQMYRELKI